MYEHAYTCYGSVRPFGISTIVAGVDKTGPGLYVVEPSGSYYGYRASAVGKGRQLAKTELEKLDLANLTVKQGVMEVARMWVSFFPVIRLCCSSSFMQRAPRAR